MYVVMYVDMDVGTLGGVRGWVPHPEKEKRKKKRRKKKEKKEGKKKREEKINKYVCRTYFLLTYIREVCTHTTWRPTEKKNPIVPPTPPRRLPCRTRTISPLLWTMYVDVYDVPNCVDTLICNYLVTYIHTYIHR